MKASITLSLLTSAVLLVGGCASHQDSMNDRGNDTGMSAQPNSVGVSTPAPNADPNNPNLSHKGPSQTGGEPAAGDTSGNGMNH